MDTSVVDKGWEVAASPMSRRPDLAHPRCCPGLGNGRGPCLPALAS